MTRGLSRERTSPGAAFRAMRAKVLKILLSGFSQSIVGRGELLRSRSRRWQRQRLLVVRVRMPWAPNPAVNRTPRKRVAGYLVR